MNKTKFNNKCKFIHIGVVGEWMNDGGPEVDDDVAVVRGSNIGTCLIALINGHRGEKMLAKRGSGFEMSRINQIGLLVCGFQDSALRSMTRFVVDDGWDH